MARTGRIRERLRWSKLYSFSCIRPSVRADAADPLHGPGFSRTVHCNNPRLQYPTNHISTTKYNILTFLPKAIFDQFRRVANLYFLLAAVLSLFPITPFKPVSLIAPLAFVVGLSMAKEALEDWRRFMQDTEVNGRKVSIHTGDGRFGYEHWQKIRVGNVVKVDKDCYFPADLLLLSSSYEDEIAAAEGSSAQGTGEVEIAAAEGSSAQGTGAQDYLEDKGGAASPEITVDNGTPQARVPKPVIKGCSFVDDRLMHGIWTKQPNPDIILLFFRILALCHTSIPEPNEETGSFTYEAESLDEGAFLVAAREFGFELCKRTQSSVFIRERDTHSGGRIEREFKVLNLLEFNSKRKRMSVIVRDETGQLLLLCKGADSIIFERLSKNGRMYQEEISKHLNEYGETGLCTLALAYRKLEESEYSNWNANFLEAKTTIGPDREAQLERVADLMERDLILVGATAVEDKLQKGVPECIDKLAQAGLKIWVLTGDKMETAINIGYSCSLLRQGMEQICISATNADPLVQEPREVVRDNILRQITNASQMIKLERDPHAAFALVIDGKTLTYALEDDMKSQFLSLAVDCASVICCRVSPKQKALVTRLVKEGTGKTTLAIGDGANDVGMIQEADIGVGISGVEGMQAVMSSDFSIAQFRFLERLLLVHGHWCYKRVAQMICYFFYKNIAFGLTIIYFEAFTGFSGQPVYDDWYMLLFNAILTSLPVISLGIFEQDVSSEVCLQFPALYQQGPKNLFFDWPRIFGWLGNGLYSSLVIFFFSIDIFNDQAFRAGGQTADMATMGTAMFTCIIWTVNLQIALMTSHCTWMQHLFVWGSIGTWYLFLLAYGLSSSGNNYQMLLEILGPAPLY